MSSGAAARRRQKKHRRIWESAPIGTQLRADKTQAIIFCDARNNKPKCFPWLTLPGTVPASSLLAPAHGMYVNVRQCSEDERTKLLPVEVLAKERRANEQNPGAGSEEGAETAVE